MATKIRVFGKSQRRTALGIVKAYATINPEAKLSDFETSFPASLNSALKAYALSSNFLTPKILETQKSDKIQSCFTDDPIQLCDGSTIYLFSLWQKADFDKIVELAPQFDIEVADYKPTEGFEKGGYRLEFINGFNPAPMVAKKKCGLWIWILLILILGALLFFLFGKTKEEPQPQPQVIEETVVEEIIIEQVKEIQTKFNAVQFELGKYDLSQEAKEALTDIIDLMIENPQIKLNIVGHSSEEGDAKTNMTLSQNRAQSVANYIISKGVEQSRVDSEGKGSSEPIDPNNRAANRRTEFIIIK